MVYAGGSGTHTPPHTDLCASIGLNVSVPVSDFNQGWSTWVVYPGGRSTNILRNHFLDLGVDIEHGTDAITIDQVKGLRDATGLLPSVWRQRAGELMLVPQSAAHSVHNNGGMSVKLAWSLMVFSSIRLALSGEAERHRRYGLFLFC